MCVIAGDFNARSTALTGDHKTNQRGRKIEDALVDSAFSVQTPVEGKWTSFAGGGHGIPDLVLANFPILDLKVLEAEALGGVRPSPPHLLHPIRTAPRESGAEVEYPEAGSNCKKRSTGSIRH